MSVTSAAGFVAAGAAAGVKESGASDLALVATDDGRAVPAAGVFTSNLMTAPPVVVSRANLQSSNGSASAVILNSGNANAATGEDGRRDAESMCSHTAAELGCAPRHVLVCSTGLIGIPLPIERIEAAIPDLVARRSVDGGLDAADAILTTDTVRKVTSVDGGEFVVGGIAKGAAMLSPNMATMLAVLTTDAAGEPADLHAALTPGVADSYNALWVDGAPSTNDTVLLLASGRAGPAAPDELARCVAVACEDLAHQMVRDAEGATKVVRVTVTGADSDDDAQRAVRQIADSMLCKCSWYGEDPYWGRIASELGSAGIAFDDQLVSIAYGGETVARRGTAVDHDAAAVQAHMAQRTLDVSADLGIGHGRATILTNDLTHAYIDENRGTS
jgi:glutamate N-acetyltransferase/amino-acid N-acetyltransferase